VRSQHGAGQGRSNTATAPFVDDPAALFRVSAHRSGNVYRAADQARSGQRRHGCTCGYVTEMADEERVRRPFWLHQIGEYLIAAVLIASAWYSPEPLVQAILGALIITNAAFADGPAGAFPIVDRRIHKWFDVVIMGLLILAALQGWVDVDTTGRIALPTMAVLMFVLWFNTDFAVEESSR
jgi:hypothetical protein